ncbi:MAG: LytR C-terminal domain-containing protein [Solirubrobacterales bacterium]|nr:LytR C-terminal domain-containing protein [Solirubrobacterales bacterium]
MDAALTITAATESLLGKGLLVPLGGIAAILAMLGMLLLLPIFLNQRREIARLTGWMDREPDAGTQEFRAIPASVAYTGSSAAADRVTSERPALARIGTAEQRAIELQRAPWWRRVIERGPRHPLVISIVAILLAAGIFYGVAHFLRAESNDAPDRLDPSTVSVVVLNASSSAGLAGEVSDRLSNRDFDVIGTSVANGGSGKSIVRYSPGADREAKLVAKVLGIDSIKPFDNEAKAAANNRAEVVAFVGDDVAGAGGKG